MTLPASLQQAVSELPSYDDWSAWNHNAVELGYLAGMEVPNPFGFKKAFHISVGNVSLTTSQAFDRFGQNPFIEGTDSWCEFQDFIENMDGKKVKKFLEWDDAPIVRLPTKRRLAQPTFKLDFDCVQDARMRLQGGLIFAGSSPYVVSDVYKYKDDFLLLVTDIEDRSYKLFYSNPAIDLRAPEPQYIRGEGKALFFQRPPAKQQHQSLRYETIWTKQVGTSNRNNIGPQDLIRGLTREDMPWDEKLSHLAKMGVFTSIRLSKDIAFYQRNGTVFAEYRGRHLGVVDDNAISVDAEDYDKPWIARDVRAIGCNTRREK